MSRLRNLSQASKPSASQMLSKTLSEVDGRLAFANSMIDGGLFSSMSNNDLKSLGSRELVLFADAVAGLGVQPPQISRNARRGLLYLQRALQVQTELRYEIFEMMGLTERALSNYLTATVGSVAPYVQALSTGDAPAAVAYATPAYGFFVVAVPRVTTRGDFNFETTVTPTTLSDPAMPYTLTPFPTVFSARGSAMQDMNNAGALYVPYMFSGNTLSVSSGGVVTTTVDPNRICNVGLAQGTIQFTGDNVTLWTYPVVPTPQVQFYALLSALQTQTSFHEALGAMLVDGWLRTGTPLQ